VWQKKWRIRTYTRHLLHASSTTTPAIISTLSLRRLLSVCPSVPCGLETQDKNTILRKHSSWQSYISIHVILGQVNEVERRSNTPTICTITGERKPNDVRAAAENSSFQTKLKTFPRRCDGSVNLAPLWRTYLLTYLRTMTLCDFDLWVWPWKVPGASTKADRRQIAFVLRRDNCTTIEIPIFMFQ